MGEDGVKMCRNLLGKTMQGLMDRGGGIFGVLAWRERETDNMSGGISSRGGSIEDTEGNARTRPAKMPGFVARTNSERSAAPLASIGRPHPPIEDFARVTAPTDRSR